MAAKKSTAKKKDGKSEDVPKVPEYLTRKLVADEPAQDRDPKYRDAAERAALLAACLTRDMAHVQHPSFRREDRDELAKAINRAWASYIGARDKHARVSLVGAIEQAAVEGLDAQAVLENLRMLYPELAGALDVE